MRERQTITRLTPVGQSGRPPVPAIVVLIWLVLICAFIRELTLQTTLIYIGDFNLTVADPVFFATCAVLAMYANRRPHLNGGAIFVIAYAAIIVINLLRGLVISTHDSLFSLRLDGAFFLLMLLAVFVRSEEWWHPRVLRAFVWIGEALSALVLLRLVFGPSFPMGQVGGLSLDEINDGGRALSAQGAVLVVMASVIMFAVYLLPRRNGGGRLGQLMASVAMFFIVVLTKQGMATILCFAAWGIVFALMPGPRLSIRLTIYIAVALTALFVYFLLPNIVSLEDINNTLPTSLSFDLAKRETTLSFRQQIWDGLLSDRETWDLTSQFFGLPAGIKPSIWIDAWGGMLWEFSVHSMYYGMLAIGGAVGLAIYCCILATAAIARVKDVIRGLPNATLGLAFVMIAALMGISNNLRNENGLLLAMAVAGYAPKAKREAKSIPHGLLRHPD